MRTFRGIFGAVTAFQQIGTAVSVRFDNSFVRVDDTESAQIVLQFLIQDGNLSVRQSAGQPVLLTTFEPGAASKGTLLSGNYLDITESVLRFFPELTLPGHNPTLSITPRFVCSGEKYTAELTWARN